MLDCPYPLADPLLKVSILKLVKCDQINICRPGRLDCALLESDTRDDVPTMRTGFLHDSPECVYYLFGDSRTPILALTNRADDNSVYDLFSENINVNRAARQLNCDLSPSIHAALRKYGSHNLF